MNLSDDVSYQNDDMIKDLFWRDARVRVGIGIAQSRPRRTVTPSLEFKVAGVRRQREPRLKGGSPVPG